MAAEGSSARCKNVVAFGRTNARHKPYLLQIAQTCASIYVTAEACCLQFRERAVDPEVAGFWDGMSTGMRDHCLHARRAMEKIQDSGALEMVENPLALLEQLRAIETKVAGILKASREPSDNGVAGSLGYSLQVYLQHPAIEWLRQSARIGIPEPILPGDASDHLNPYLESFLRHFASSPFTLALADSLNQLRAQNLRLRSQNTADPVTGAFNRNGILEVISAFSGLAERNGHTIAVLMIGIDHLDKIHETQGQSVLNQMIRALYHKIASTIRKSDLLGRYDFSAFLAFLPNTDHRNLLRIAERVGKAARSLNRPGNELLVRIGGSFGRIDRKADRQARHYIEKAVDCLMRAGNSPRNSILIE